MDSTALLETLLMTPIKKPGGRLTLPKPWSGFARAWVRCKQCGRVQWYQYQPYSFSQPYLELSCGHNPAIHFNERVDRITEVEAILALAQLYDEIIDLA